ncbi:MAG: aminotransferase class I/II-fold pyridoxal phosphate-dependent enzyme, partial [Pseudobdellovibrionaceae bacterium]
GVFSMSGAIAPYDQIHALAKKYNAHTYVDEAHGVGVLGPGGRGAAAQYGLKPDYLMGTFSKSLASQGGFVCGSKEAIDWMRLKARTMMFSAALAPASVAAAEKSLEILIESPQMVNDLKMKSDYFRERMKAKGLNVIDSQTSIVSVLIGDDTEALAMSKKLENDGVFATPVLSPAVPRGRTLIRCSVIATHKFSDLDAVAEIFAKNIQSLKSKDKPSTASLHAMMDDGLTPEQVHSYLGAQL